MNKNHTYRGFRIIGTNNGYKIHDSHIHETGNLYADTLKDIKIDIDVLFLKYAESL